MSNIKKARKALGLSQKEVALQIGLSYQHFCLIETGKATNITKETMEKIASALNTTVPELFYTEEKVA